MSLGCAGGACFYIALCFFVVAAFVVVAVVAVVVVVVVVVVFGARVDLEGVVIIVLCWYGVNCVMYFWQWCQCRGGIPCVLVVGRTVGCPVYGVMLLLVLASML